MRDLDLDRKRSTAPMLALLAAGLVAGGTWELAAHLDGAPSAVPAVEVEVAVEGWGEAEAPEVDAILIPPPPVPAPVVEQEDISAAPRFTPFTTAPQILNRAEVVEAMRDNYPPLLRDAAVGGTTRVYFFIDAEGTAVKTLIDVSSGHRALDQAALEVAKVYRFSPALMRGDPVPVWVSFGITFQVR